MINKDIETPNYDFGPREKIFIGTYRRGLTIDIAKEVVRGRLELTERKSTWY